MPKVINPYMDFVLGLDDEQFELLCDAINQVKDKKLYGASSFEEAANLYKRERFVQYVIQVHTTKMVILMQDI